MTEDEIRKLAEEAVATEYEIDYIDEKYYVKGFTAGFLAAQKKGEAEISDLKKVIEIMIETIKEIDEPIAKEEKQDKKKTFRERLDAAMEATKQERIKKFESLKHTP